MRILIIWKRIIREEDIVKFVMLAKAGIHFVPGPGFRRGAPILELSRSLWPF